MEEGQEVVRSGKRWKRGQEVEKGPRGFGEGAGGVEEGQEVVRSGKRWTRGQEVLEKGQELGRRGKRWGGRAR